jgi:hypothetical protein
MYTSQTSHLLPLNSGHNLGEILRTIQRTIHDFCNFTVREEHRLRVIENWVLKGIFGPKMKD